MAYSAENKKNIKKTERSFEGRVVSDKMDKTIVVEVSNTFRHPEFGKIIRRTKKYKVHDENNSARCGDFVKIAECRPLSRDKHMTLLSVNNSASV